ncbi:Outer membrane protein TolC [Granulicella rosea]|uniref:Outer membrane protein TolC n=1 Tax=Granulicella rosea TaxID=474952 RepID=A0A239D081_9BACT|nr:TolC family protein [Granulicella rosea]SNS24993.1 Outer membrane protein TolC [Granulicella rosea]
MRFQKTTSAAGARHKTGLLLTSAALVGISLPALAQEPATLPPAPSAVKSTTELPGAPAGTVVAAQPGAMPLSLDDAIALGLRHNLQILLAQQQERYVRGETLTVGNALLPDLTATAFSRAQEINLAAMGFKPGSIKIPGIVIPQIVKVNTTSAQVNLSQALFNVPAYYLYRAAQKAQEGAGWNTLNARGATVLSIGTGYLRVLADAAMVANATALVKQDEEVFHHAQASHDAGVGLHLDVLRAQVQLQQQQQTLIQDEDTLAKDKIALNRQMGIPADQELQLTDVTPYNDFSALSIEDARALAYTRRKDLLNLQAQMAVAEQARKAVRYERLPSVSVGGYYGLLGETTGMYHGNFAAQGSVKFPIFEEGTLRGQREVAEAQMIALRRQVESLKVTIESQIRSSMLDVQSSSELVKVARSNVELSTQELADATLRYEAGVDDNLPVVRAQAALAGAQAQLIQNEFQYNGAKLQLARNTGVVETQYKDYLGK